MKDNNYEFGGSGWKHMYSPNPNSKECNVDKKYISFDSSDNNENYLKVLSKYEKEDHKTDWEQVLYSKNNYSKC